MTEREYFTKHYIKLFSEVGAIDCMNCGHEGALHLHHVVPLSRGGTNKITNLRALCVDCHANAHHDTGVSGHVVRSVQKQRRYDELNYSALKELYIDKDMPSTEIAKLIGCSTALVTKRCAQFNLTKQTSADAIIKYFAEMPNGSSAKGSDIQRILGIHRNTFGREIASDRIVEAMKIYGIKKEKTRFIKV